MQFSEIRTFRCTPTEMAKDKFCVLHVPFPPDEHSRPQLVQKQQRRAMGNIRSQTEAVVVAEVSRFRSLVEAAAAVVRQLAGQQPQATQTLALIRVEALWKCPFHRHRHNPPSAALHPVAESPIVCSRSPNSHKCTVSCPC